MSNLKLNQLDTFCLSKGFIIIPIELKVESATKLEKRMVASLLKTLLHIGYTLSQELIDLLSNCDQYAIKEAYDKLVSYALDASYARYSWKPFYPDFPEQVMELSDAELYLSACYHYLTGEQIWSESGTPKLVLDLDEESWTSLRTIKLGTLKNVYEIINSYTNSNVALGEAQYNDIKWFASTYPNDFVLMFPVDKFNNQEVQAKVLSIAIGTKVINLRSITVTKYLNTATAVLRLLVALSDGNVSLAGNVKFRRFTTSETKAIATILNGLDNLNEDVLRHQDKWKLFFQLIRVGQFYTTHPKLAQAVEVVRGKLKIHTFASRTEQLIHAKDWTGLTDHLSSRPSEFARKINRLMDLCPERDYIIKKFCLVAHECSVTVLLNLITFYQNRDKQTTRLFMPKGGRARAFATKNDLDTIDENSKVGIINACFNGLVGKFRDHEPLGKVYLDPAYVHFAVPLVLRNASRAERVIARGTTFKLGDAPILRPFVYWRNDDERVDIDHNLSLLDTDGNLVQEISYYSLVDEESGCCHSGDIVTSKGGSCEFTEINIDNLIKTGVRYVVFSLTNFTNLPFTQLESGYAGWMLRSEGQFGEVFEPATVQHRFDIMSDAKSVIPVVFDLERRIAIWMDLEIKPNSGILNLRRNSKNVHGITKAFMDKQFPTLYTLLLAHVTARGELVSTPEEADLVFSLDETKSDMLPWQIEKITNYLS